MARALFFDLDGTLFDVRQYFWGAFGDVSDYISNKYGLSRQSVFQALSGLWQEKTSMYSHLYNDLIAQLNLEKGELQKLIKIFNEHTAKMQPYPDVAPTLRMLRTQGCKLGLITDGNVGRQQRKLQMLNLENYFDVVIYAREVEPKPSSLPFIVALDRLNVQPADSFYTADNPSLDFKGAKEAGMHTVRILRGEFADLATNEHIDYEIERISQLLKIVE